MILSDKVIISDPCYEYGKYEEGTLTLPIIAGKYETTIDYLEGRIAEIQVVHKDYAEETKVWEEAGTIFVDSGDAGVFDYSLKDLLGDKEDDEASQAFYDKCGDYTCFGNGYGSEENFFVSRTFAGDGSYPVYITRNNNGAIFGINIRYFEEEEDV